MNDRFYENIPVRTVPLEEAEGLQSSSVPTIDSIMASETRQELLKRAGSSVRLLAFALLKEYGFTMPELQEVLRATPNAIYKYQQRIVRIGQEIAKNSYTEE